MNFKAFVIMIWLDIVVPLALLLLSSIVQAESEIKLHTTGGENVTTDEYSYIVSIRDSKLEKHFCGGALITERNILSAAHCLKKRRLKPESIYVALGVYNRLDKGVRRNVKRITVHPGFDFSNVHNDISIITTYNKITFTQHIQPIELPQANIFKNGIFNLQAVFIGWGRLKYTEREEDRVLLPETLKIQKAVAIDWAECASKFARLSVEDATVFEAVKKYLNKNVICTNNKIGKGFCNGDSGGPLAAKLNGVNQIIGISSWGINCGIGYPDVYTNVFKYFEWIQSEIRRSS